MIVQDNNSSSQSDSPGWNRLGIAGKLLSIILLCAIFVSLASIAWILTTCNNSDITEFYLLNEYGEADNYPVTVSSGNQFSVIAGIVNHGQQSRTFDIEVSVNDTIYSHIGPINIGADSKHEEHISIRPGAQIERQKVEFTLLENGAPSPGQVLTLMINVIEEE